jgi:hypothetical protein
MNTLFYFTRSRSLCSAVIAVAFATTATVSAQTRQGNPYVPPGANYTITAVQGVDDAHPLGQSGAQVNTDFEFKPSIGVTYDQGNGRLKDFGIGLYEGPGKQAESTGLRIDYNTAVDPNTATVTVMDFDIKSLGAGFKTKKVEPAMVLLGDGMNVLTTATPTDVLNVMTPVAGQDDTWTVNLGALLAEKHVNATSIKGVQLHADAKNGESTKSDPYLLKSANNPMQTPEPGTLLVLGAGALFARRRMKKAKA